MLLLSLFNWWYGVGFRGQLKSIKMMFSGVNDQFSIPLLLKTLFQPFRQISNERVDGALEDKMRAWLDRMVSRLIGGFIRTIVMIIGILAMIAVAIFGLIRIIIWLVLPLLPLLGIFLMMYVGIPWENIELRLPWI
jgi:hypothetical protein